MKILITGSGGFLGSELSTAFSKEYDVINLSRREANINCDLSISVPEIPPVDLVIHSAGKAHSIPRSKIDCKEFYDVNVRGIENLISSLELNATLPKYFIFISTVAVYGKSVGYNISENSPLEANEPYGKSKIIAENIISNWCSLNDIKLTILRLPLLIGSNPKGNLEKMINAIAKGYYFNIGGGITPKSMLLVSDVSKFIKVVYEVGGIFNLSDGYNPTFFELSNLIGKQIGRNYIPNIPVFLAKILALFGDYFGRKMPLNSDKLRKILSPLTFDDSRAKKIIGWQPTPVLQGFRLKQNNE